MWEIEENIIEKSIQTQNKVKIVVFVPSEHQYKMLGRNMFGKKKDDMVGEKEN
jgi:hypothetical protein